MAHEIRIPQLGVNDTKAILVDWAVKNQSQVKAGQEIFTIETSKVTQAVTADHSGFIKQKASIGEELDLNSIVGWITESLAEKPVAAAVAIAPASGVQLTQKAKDLAEKLGVNIADLPQTAGILREKDIQDFVGAKTPAAPKADLPAQVPASLVASATPLSRAQKFIKEAMLKSLASNAGSFVSIELKLDALNKKLSALTASGGVAVRVNEAVLYASARALMEFPQFNGFFWNDQFVQYKTVNIGVAVDQEGLLLVPVIQNAQTKTVAEIARESGLLQMKVLRGKLSAADCENGTFTVTNLFGMGVQLFVPIINGHQAAILAVGGGPDNLILGVTYDHRINNGMAAARFLKSIASHLENIPQ